MIFVDALPKTATGKIKRFELRERAAADGVLRAERREETRDEGSFASVVLAIQPIHA